MSLDVYLQNELIGSDETVTVFAYNITHNLNVMAEAAGIYKHLWRPEELGIDTAGDLIKPLTEGLNKLKEDKRGFKKLNPRNGWGNYDGLVKFVSEYVDACNTYPKAEIIVHR